MEIRASDGDLQEAGADHPHTLASMRNKALTYRDRGR
jgi:hypothetical protein